MAGEDVGQLCAEMLDIYADGRLPNRKLFLVHLLSLLVRQPRPILQVSLPVSLDSIRTACEFMLKRLVVLSADFNFRSYFRVISVATQGGTVTTYSDRFTITGMTGVTDPTIKAAVTAAGGAVPAAVDGTANNAAAAAGDPNANSGVPYAEQTGLIRYAPMQGVPPTKITKKDTKPLYPTSSYKIAVSFLPTPSQTKTVTASQTFSADSMENTVSFPPLIGFLE